MGIRIVCVDPNAQAHNPRVLINGPSAACGEVIEVDDVTAAGLIDQPDVWRLHDDEPALADSNHQPDLEDEAGDENHEEIQ